MWMQTFWRLMRQLQHHVRRVYPLLCYLIQNNDQIHQLMKPSSHNSRNKELEQALNYLDLLNKILFSHILETGWQHD
jgi:uncharacterized protein YjgD (DUF1641 family)